MQGCKSGSFHSMRRESRATTLWFEDLMTGEVLGGSKTEPEFIEP
jgi:hypothetical protein